MDWAKHRANPKLHHGSIVCLPPKARGSPASVTVRAADTSALGGAALRLDDQPRLGTPLQDSQNQGILDADISHRTTFSKPTLVRVNANSSKS